jgi:AcrR family transcriptional regulator
LANLSISKLQRKKRRQGSATQLAACANGFSGREALIGHILDAAAEAFAQRGYERTSMRQVGREVGLSQSHLYYYVKSKPLLLFETQRQAVVLLLELLRRIEASTASPLEKLRCIIREILRLIADRPAAVAVYLHERKSLPPRLLRALHQEGAEANAIIDRILCQGQAAGELRKMDLVILRQAVISVASFPYQWLRTGPDARLSYQQVSKILTDIVIQGVAETQGTRRAANGLSLVARSKQRTGATGTVGREQKDS